MNERMDDNDDDRTDQRTDRSEGTGRGHRDRGILYACIHVGLHAVVNGVGKKSSTRKRAVCSRVILKAKRKRGASEGRLVKKAKRGHWQGGGGENRTKG